MLRYKYVLAVLATFIMLFSMVGCSSTGNGTTNTTNTTDTTAAPVAEENTTADPIAAAIKVQPGKKGVIDFWTVFTGGDGDKAQAIVDKYNATNPDYTVNMRQIPENDLYLKMPLAIRSGQNVPDLAINHIDRVPYFSELGLYDDFTPYLAASPIKAENYIQSAWTPTEINGARYGIPLDLHSFGTYINMDLLAKYAPNALDKGFLTWDDIKAAGPACLKDGIVPVGIGWHRVDWLASYAQLNGVLSTDGKNPDFNNADGVAVLQLWQDLNTKGFVQKSGDDGWKMFIGGKMLCMPEGDWMISSATESSINWKFTEFPAWDAQHRGCWASSHQFVLPKNPARDAEKTAACLQFIDWYGQHSLDWAAAGHVPAYLSVYNSPEFKAMPQSFMTNDYFKIYSYKYFGYVTTDLDKVLKDALYGNLTPQGALDQCVQNVKDDIAAGN